MVKLRILKLSAVSVAIFQVLYGFFFLIPQVNNRPQAAPFTTAYATMSNSRLSVKGLLGSATSSNATNFTFNGTGTASYTDIDTGNLFPGDTVCFNNPASNGCSAQLTYTVQTVPSSSLFITSAQVANTLNANDAIVSTQSGRLTVTFRPATQIVSGEKVVITIPATATVAKYADGIPDADGFDAAALPADLLGGTGCTSNACLAVSAGGIYSAWTMSAAALATNVNTHTITITASSTLATANTYGVVIGHASNAALRFLNPAPKTTSHTRGNVATSETYTIGLSTTNSGGGTTYDSTNLKVAPIDGVLVSATVEQTLTYQINDSSNGYSGNVSSSTNVTQCNGGSFTTTSASTPTAVPFGSITTFNSFYRVAQTHYITTNAPSGYTLTAMENQALGLNGSSPTIADTACDSGPCTSSSSQAWTTASNNGFGYTLGNITGTDAAFTSNFRPFDSSSPITIMSKNSTTSGSRIATCYQLSVSSSQQAGFYYNKLTYVATPKF